MHAAAGTCRNKEGQQDVRLPINFPVACVVLPAFPTQTWSTCWQHTQPPASTLAAWMQHPHCENPYFLLYVVTKSSLSNQSEKLPGWSSSCWHCHGSTVGSLSLAAIGITYDCPCLCNHQALVTTRTRTVVSCANCCKAWCRS